tara:strand:- start:405 stop:725 length:321 start_codon:yes stop_codon:yes gene_type:complete
MTTSRVAFTQKHAPGLVHLAAQLEPFDSLIVSFTAGPQGSSDPFGIVPHILIQPEIPYMPNLELCVCIRGEDDCTVYSEGDEYEITFQGLLDYLKQLPRPIWSFAK